MLGFRKIAKNEIEAKLDAECELLKKSLSKDTNSSTAAKAIYIDYGLGALDRYREDWQLDFSTESIKRVEERLGVMHDQMTEAQPSTDAIDGFVKLFGGYIGCVMMQTGWEWGVDGNNPLDLSKVVVERNGKRFYILSKIYKRLMNGSEDNIWDAYYIIEQMK